MTTQQIGSIKARQIPLNITRFCALKAQFFELNGDYRKLSLIFILLRMIIRIKLEERSGGYEYGSRNPFLLVIP
jgi:hypothetical protein